MCNDLSCFLLLKPTGMPGMPLLVCLEASTKTSARTNGRWGAWFFSVPRWFDERALLVRLSHVNFSGHLNLKFLEQKLGCSYRKSNIQNGETVGSGNQVTSNLGYWGRGQNSADMSYLCRSWRVLGAAGDDSMYWCSDCQHFGGAPDAADFATPKLWRCIPCLEDWLSQLVYKWLVTMVSCCPLRIGLWDPFQMAFLWLMNGGLLLSTCLSLKTTYVYAYTCNQDFPKIGVPQNGWWK